MKSILSFKTLLLIVPLLAFISCDNDLWDEHYKSEVSEKSELNIFEYIKSREELSLFRQALEKTGYDKLLSEDYTYTVWAPVNSALSGLDMNDNLQVERVVKNHITRFTHPTSRIQDKSFLMLNGKVLNFQRHPDNSFTLHGKAVLQPDIAVKNGMIHLMNEYVPYILNLWEYIQIAQGVDSIRSYIQSLTRVEFDFDASYLDGVLIDSVFKETNRVLTSLASLNREDSIYTALLPTDMAWDSRLAKLYPYFKTLEADGGVLAQSTNARWMMVRDLFFRERLNQPFTNDSLYSTAGTLFTNGSSLIPSSNPIELSNGYAYTVDSYQQKPTESWLLPIKIEAENAMFGRTSRLYDLSTYSALGSGMDVSNNFYIHARALSTLSIEQMSVNFPIPNTLATKYNIYVVFVPMSITDPSDSRAFKVRFSLNYNYGEGTAVDSVWIGPNGFVPRHTQAKQFTTTSRELTKLLVLENYEFPWANIVMAGRNQNMILSDKIRVGLRVENAAGTTALERLNFSRDIRIDCIILEPVIE